MKPVTGDSVKWLPRDSTRRKLGACKGTYVGTDSDGWYLVSYVWGAPGAYKNRTVRIEPSYVVEIKPRRDWLTDHAVRLREAGKRLNDARRKAGI